ncbi:type II 3-dehydroquinate dehydratase [Govanella unica]|uniref:3-dehydroquinate dehydratase n=1 Tax=Govanella unica TaxID=2975056 RepID=A0A9X3Z725_9PROT|nr:type II 3-dehydroquinate dehydratase [Govania unica]MDA5193534.1 type II 3-dehydroquinate dehydratase [Govania unica]
MAKRLKHSILVLNGPNLNLLGTREPEVYGRDTLADIAAGLERRGAEIGLGIDFQQWNGEGEMVTAIQAARGTRAGIIINPAAYTHTSIALLDALLAVELPVIEVHLSNPHKREDYRHKSYVSRMAQGVICGFGSLGYYLALDAMSHILDVSPAK